MDQLPVDSIRHILALTSPKDACRLAGVSSVFRSAADSDLLWMSFLPADYRDIIAQSTSSSMSLFLNSLPEKDLFFQLCDHPLLIGNGNTSFALEEECGKKCYMIGAKGPRWNMWPVEYLQSRFNGVVILERSGTPLRMSGSIRAKKLSPKTYYGAYFVFWCWCTRCDYSQSLKSIQSCFYSEEGEVDKKEMEEKMKPLKEISFKIREDGWMEVEIGQIFIEQDNDSTLVFSLLHNIPQGGDLVPEGIEIRPKKFKKLPEKKETIKWLPPIIFLFLSLYFCFFFFNQIKPNVFSYLFN